MLIYFKNAVYSVFSSFIIGRLELADYVLGIGEFYPCLKIPLIFLFFQQFFNNSHILLGSIASISLQMLDDESLNLKDYC